MSEKVMNKMPDFMEAGDGEKKNSDQIGLIISIFICILATLIILYRLYSRSSSRRGILLTGLCDTGKTLLFARLVFEKFINTQTSIKENVADYALEGGQYKIVDVPGHERLRNRFFDQFKDISQCIIYVVDSVTIQKDIRDVAEYLYNILTDSVVVNNKPRILILCNKQDLPMSKGCNAIKSILEKELNTLRVTKANQLESVDPKAKRIAFLGDEDGDFEFSQLNIKVDFAGVNLTSRDKESDYNIKDLNEWLSKVCK